MVTEFHGTLPYGMLTQEDGQTAPEGFHEARVWNAWPMKGDDTPSTVQAETRLSNCHVDRYQGFAEFTWS